MRTLFKLTWVEIKLFIREPITVVFTLALPIIFLFVMGGVFGNTPNPDVYRGVGPMDYYMPSYYGLIMMAIGTVALPVHLAGYRERGVLRRFRASSLSVWSVLGSQLLVSFIIAIAGSILVTILGKVASPLHPFHPGGRDAAIFYHDDTWWRRAAAGSHVRRDAVYRGDNAAALGDLYAPESLARLRLVHQRLPHYDRNHHSISWTCRPLLPLGVNSKKTAHPEPVEG
jgi:hypothetical protein